MKLKLFNDYGRIGKPVLVLINSRFSIPLTRRSSDHVSSMKETQSSEQLWDQIFSPADVGPADPAHV